MKTSRNAQVIIQTVLAATLTGALLFSAPCALAKDSIATATRSGKAFATRVAEENGIPRFALVEPGVARGGQPSEAGVRYLKEQGYKTVISFIEGSPEREQVQRLGMRYVEIPIHSNFLGAKPPTDRQVLQFLSIVCDPSNRPVFYHCLRGRDRTGAMTALYRVNHCGWSPQEADEEMVAFGYRKHYRSMRRLVFEWPERMKALAQAPAAAPSPAAVVSPAGASVPATP